MKGIVVACDFSLPLLEKVIDHAEKDNLVIGYKIGFYLSLRYGLKKVVNFIRKRSGKLIIYDHQKGGTDIPEMGKKFMAVCSDAGIDKVILFPFAGRKTEEEWIDYAREYGLEVIIGCGMSHPFFFLEENGFIPKKSCFEAYEIAYKKNIREFVVPATKLEFSLSIKRQFPDVTFYLPGIGKQGGKIEEIDKVIGDNWYGIIGRSYISSILE